MLASRSARAGSSACWAALRHRWLASPRLRRRRHQPPRLSMTAESRPSNLNLIARLEADPGVTFTRRRSPVKAVVLQLLGGLIIGIAIVALWVLMVLNKQAAGANALVGASP